jgi:hypothetical protein
MKRFARTFLILGRNGAVLKETRHKILGGLFNSGRFNCWLWKIAGAREYSGSGIRRFQEYKGMANKRLIEALDSRI